MPDVQYRAVLDATDVLLKIAQVENKLLGIPQRAPIVFRVNDTAAKASLTSIEQRLKRLGSGNTQRITISLGGSRTSTDPLIGQLAQAERELRRLTLASAGTLGMTQRLGGIFGFLPGPIGLYASAASTLRGSLTGLNAAQALNTVGAFALATGFTAIGTSVAALASHGIKQLGEFQAAVNTLNAQGEGLGNGFDARIRDLQAGGGRVAQQFNRAELGTGAADLTKQGLQEADAMKVLATSYRLAGAEGQNLLESSTLLLANLRQFGFDGPAAAKEAAHFGDVLAKGSLQAASGAKELQIGLSVVGPAAHAMGLSLEETIGYLVAMDNAGLKASTIGANAFRAVLLALASPTGVAAREIDKLGVALKNADGSARPVRDVLIDLRKAAKISGQAYDENTQAAVRSADTVSAVSSIFRSRGVVGFLNMTDAVDKYTDGLNASEGALDQYATSLTEGPAKAQERLRKSVDDLALSFAQTFGPKLTQGLDLVTKSFRDLDELTRRPEAIKAYLDAIATGIGGITVALTLNTLASKGALGAGGFAGFIKLIEGTVAGGVLVKAATYLKQLALVGSVAFKLNGFTGLVTTLLAIPAVAGAALAAVTLLATGVIAANFKIAGDIHKTYDQIDAAATQQTQSLLARVETLRKQGPLGNLKAKQLLTIDMRYNVENSPETNAQLDVTLLKLKAQIKAEEDRQAAQLASQKGRQKDLLATAEQNDAYDGLITRLDDLSTRFGEVKTTSFQKNLQDARKSLEDFNAEVDKQAGKGELTPTQATALKKRAADAQPDLIASLTTRQLEEDRKTLVGFQRETDQVRLSLIKDGRAKRQEEYDAEVSALREKYGPEIRDALTNAQAKGLTPTQRRSLQEGAGELQAQENRALVLARKKLNDDLAQLDEDRALKTRNAATAGLAQTASEMEGNTKILQGEYTRQVELAGTSVAGRLAAERRLAPLLEAQRGEARQARLTADRAAARNEYDDAVRAARDQGSARSRLEEEARTTYLSKSRALEAAYQDDVEGYHLDTLHAIQEAGAAVTKKQLDLDLKSIQTWTGAQLAAYARMLEAKKATALADGDVARVKVLSDALETIAGQEFDNLTSFKQDVADAAKGLEDLRTRLDNLNPNKDPRQAALSSAASPFNSLLTDAGKQQRDLTEAFGKLTPEQQRAQLASYQAQQGELSRLILDANRQRNTAILTADQAFDRERQDKAEASALKLAKTTYERTQNSAPYLAALQQDRAYWQARLQIAKEGSQERATAEQHLADTLAGIATVQQADRERQDKVQVARLKFATSAYDRLRAQQPQGGVVDVGAYLKALDQDRTYWAARVRIAKEGSQELSEAQQHLADNAEARQKVFQEALSGGQEAARQHLAELNSAKDLATTQTQIVLANARISGELETQLLRRRELAAQQETDAARELEREKQRLTFAYNQSVVFGQGSPDERAKRHQDYLDAVALLDNQAAAASADRGRQLAQDEEAIHQEQVRHAREQAREQDALRAATLRVQEAQTAYADAVARSNAEVVAGKQRGILDTQNELAEIDRQLAERERRGLTDVDVQGLIAERIGKQTSLYGQQKALREYLASLDRDALALLESQIALQQRLTGAVNDPVASKAADLAATRRALAQNARELVNPDASEADRVKLQTTRNGLLGEEVTQQRELVQLGLQIQQSEVALGQARQQAALKLAGLGADAVASAQLDLDLARQRLAAKREDLTLAERDGQGQVVLNGLRKEEVELVGQVYDAEQKVVEAGRARQTLLDGLVVASRELAAASAGGSDEEVKRRAALDAVATAQERVTAAQREYQRVQGEAADEAARNGRASTGTLERLKTSTEGLTGAITAQRSALQGVADLYTSQLSAMDSVRDSAEALRKAMNGGSDVARFDGNRELDRFRALEQRRAAAIRQSEEALASGDAGRIAKTTSALAALEERYQKQGKLLGENGINVSLSGGAAVARIADQVDRLGIKYDRESIEVAERARVAEQQSKSVSEFGTYVTQFGKLVGQPIDPAKEAELLGKMAEMKALEPLAPEPSRPQEATPVPQPQGVTPAQIAAAVQATVQALAVSPKAASQRPAAAPPPAGAVDNRKTVTVNHNWGGVTITAQPGQDARALYDDIMAEAQRRGDLTGSDC